MEIQKFFNVTYTSVLTIVSSALTIQCAITTAQFAIKFFNSFKDIANISNLYFYASLGSALSVSVLVNLTIYCFNKALSYYNDKPTVAIDLSKKSIKEVEGAAENLGV